MLAVNTFWDILASHYLVPNIFLYLVIQNLESWKGLSQIVNQWLWFRKRKCDQEMVLGAGCITHLEFVHLSPSGILQIDLTALICSYD